MLIQDSKYWFDAIALEPVKQHEIVVVEIRNDKEYIRHAHDTKDWFKYRTAYVNQAYIGRDISLRYNRSEEWDKGRIVVANEGEYCRCVAVDVWFR